ncbi:hypothetical protein NDU88_004695 [Pleurodeles waltl]|uniref:Uncharacterized protein n=1 Tax=Pleurodeles waltl TaxID=8319 RepID=A0AAV7UFX8_PLEWA|nr:hypothetical protein NDU88_004695 [Pleurodeles waltl]
MSQGQGGVSSAALHTCRESRGGVPGALLSPRCLPALAHRGGAAAGQEESGWEQQGCETPSDPFPSLGASTSAKMQGFKVNAKTSQSEIRGCVKIAGRAEPLAQFQGEVTLFSKAERRR